ncbi:MAG: hypothetical protein ABIW38_04830 [Ferruginibacter sp.]
MKKIFFLLTVIAFFSACKKDKYTTAPQISFVDIKPNASRVLLSNERDFAPKLIFKITDAEGDFGTNDPLDSSMIYVKNLLINKLDSFRFPDITGATKKDFSAEVSLNLFNALICRFPGPARPRVDTTYLEFYVRDAKKNKSNVVTSSKPLYIICD